MCQAEPATPILRLREAATCVPGWLVKKMVIIIIIITIAIQSVRPILRQRNALMCVFMIIIIVIIIINVKIMIPNAKHKLTEYYS